MTINFDMTTPGWTEWARRQWPGLTDDEVSTLLWGCTSFPMGTIADVEAEFIAVRDRAGSDVLRALEMADEAKERI